MTTATIDVHPPRARRSPAHAVWFPGMFGMWVVFFALLIAQELGALWGAIRALPTALEVLVWVAFLPWMLGMAVWNASWAEWVRITLVILLALFWTGVSAPHGGGERRTRARELHP